MFLKNCYLHLVLELVSVTIQDAESFQAKIHIVQKYTITYIYRPNKYKIYESEVLYMKTYWYLFITAVPSNIVIWNI